MPYRRMRGSVPVDKLSLASRGNQMDKNINNTNHDESGLKNPEITKEGMGPPEEPDKNKDNNATDASKEMEADSAEIRQPGRPGMEIKEAAMVFTPKLKLARTPPRRNSMPSSGYYRERSEKDEDQAQVSKRKRQNESPEEKITKISKEGERVKRVIQTMVKQISDLEDVLKHAYKPKKEICEICSKLSYYAEKISSEEITRWLEKTTTDRNDVEQALRMENEELRKEIRSYKQKENSNRGIGRVSIGIQTDFDEIKRESEIRKLQIKAKIENIFEEPTAYDNFVQIVDEKWPEERYQITKLQHGKESWPNTDKEDQAIFIDQEPRRAAEELGKLRIQLPSMGSLIQEGLVEGKMEFIKCQVEVMSSRNKSQEQYTNTTYVLPMRMDKGLEDIQKMYDLATQLKEEIHKQGGKHLKVITAGQTNMNYIRKVVEYIFRDTEMNITVVCQTGERKNTGSNRRSQKMEKEKIIVKAKTGESYADLLKSVKSSVNIKEKGIEIKTIRKTNKGDLLLEVMGGKGKANELKQTILQKNQNTDVTIKVEEMVVHITDIDASIESEELREEIMKEEHIEEHQVRVISMRPAQNGNQTATVAMNRKAALKVIDRGKIKIGWVNCRVRKRVNLLRCFRCHLFGHRREECKEKDRSELCLKCLQQGHIAKECKNMPKCIICNTEGHRADQTKCPEYRRLIKQKGRLSTFKEPQYRTLSVASSVFEHGT